MRGFDAPDGQRWQAALLEASYGQVLLIFSADQGGALRQHPMPAEHLAQASEQLAALDDAALAALLAQAAPWQPGV
ncbi:MAG TPA: hypothetical protein PLL92_17320 [Alicycliphilus sp.]|nr:hypothetical protein [Alicycliphilus sp.]